MIWQKIFDIYNSRLFPRLSWLRGTTILREKLENKAILDYTKNAKFDFKMTDINDYKHCVIETELVEKFRKQIDENTIVVDVGGYHGFYSLLAASERCSQVHCFEISESNCKKKGKKIFN